MCGIAGFVDFGRTSSFEILVAMTDSLKHRGPDGRGFKFLNRNTAFVGLGHRRLSILDLSEAGAQPMIKHDCIITYNGEIYNYREIAKELEGFGYHFMSSSDTEVILSAYDKWGEHCVDRFRGMFAFVIYDQRLDRIVFFRDRMGIKPLFLYEDNDIILFASELKAFHLHPKFKKVLDFNAVRLYFKYGFIPSPLSIFKNVRKLAPGHLYEVSLNGVSRDKVYWNPTDFLKYDNDYHVDEEKLEEELEHLLTESFNYRMVSDVPVGIFLSGGYDSSVLTAILQADSTAKINTFTIGFEDKAYCEAIYAEDIARFLGTNHTSYTCTKSEAQSIIGGLPDHYDEPFGDSSSIPTFLVSRVTSESVKVALSADGGDELFGGYGRNLRFLSIAKNVSRVPVPLRKILGRGTRFISNYRPGSIEKGIWWSKTSAIITDPSLLNIFDNYPQFFNDRIISDLLIKDHSTNFNPQLMIKNDLSTVSDPLNALLSFDYQSTLTNDMLVKVDRATMANSIEGREPMLDHHLYEYLARIPSSCKIKDGVLKYILKNITHKHIPKEIMNRPKKGFSVPIKHWLKTDLKHLVEDNFQESSIRRHGVLNVDYTKDLVKKLMKENSNSNDYLWLLLSFQMWCERWL